MGAAHPQCPASGPGLQGEIDCVLPEGHDGDHLSSEGAYWPADGYDTPAPRDGDLTRLLRAAMKRYGVPAVMAEAGRLAQQRL